MKLYEMLKLAKYYQKVWIFEHNDFDQNMPIFKGIVDDARADKDKTFDFLMDDVECYDCTTGTLIIYVRNEYSDERRMVMAEWVVEITDGLPHLKNMKPLIRCKDCDYYTPSEKRCWNERITADGIIEPDWFCADGVRKDE